MRISTIILLIWWVVWCLNSIWRGFQLRLGIDCWRGKRKFFYIKATCFLWEENGQWEFSLPARFRQPYQNYLSNHPYEFEQLVEILETDSPKVYYFAAVDSVGEWDWSFRDKSRGPFNTFHINKELVKEIKPVKFSWKKFCLTYNN